MSVSQTSPVVLSGDFGSVVVIIKSRSSLSSSLSLYDSCCCWCWGGWRGEGHGDDAGTTAMLQVLVANMNSKYVFTWFSHTTAPPIVGTVFTLSKCQPTPTTPGNQEEPNHQLPSLIPFHLIWVAWTSVNSEKNGKNMGDKIELLPCRVTQSPAGVLDLQ